MEANKEEALKAKEIAEKRFAERDFTGAKNYALKAKTLYPGMEGTAQLLATFDVYIASEAKSHGEIDYYSVLGLKPSASRESVKKQYRKMAVLLHPDKNKSVGADGAFKLVSEAWTLLSDNGKRSTYDHKRTTQLAPGVNQTSYCSNSSTPHGVLDTFWTVCTSCKVQYEYLRKYVNKRLSCKNCRGTFIAIETGLAPVNGSFPYYPQPFVPGNGYGGHGCDGVTYIPTDAAYYTGNGVSTFHSGHGYDNVSNWSFQWGSISGASSGTVQTNGPQAFGGSAYQVNGNVSRAGMEVLSRTNGKRAMKNNVANNNSGAPSSCNDIPGSEDRRLERKKKKRIVVGTTFRNGYGEKEARQPSEVSLANGNASVDQDHKNSKPTEFLIRQNSNAPLFDARKLLIEKARTEIRKKLEEMKMASATATATATVAVNKSPKPEGLVNKVRKVRRAPKKAYSSISGQGLEPKRGGPTSINVPDPDFHDFDKDRLEECFKPKQIWALYDEEDGMPRLYCLIREVISVRPFQILITFLGSKTDIEFGSVNWLDCGFTKSCGKFRAMNSDVFYEANIFSHLLSREKTGRGGCVKIYPKKGDIWAVYRNWSPDWDRSTPDEVRHQYEMVEVLDDYSEELGVCVTPLVKLAGFKTVYQSDSNQGAVRWIPRREMLRFSHQVPSYLLKGEATNLPDKCWDLDPAATPDELLHTVKETKD